MRSIACCEPLLVLRVQESQAGAGWSERVVEMPCCGGGGDGGRYHRAVLPRAHSIEGHGLRCEIQPMLLRNLGVTDRLNDILTCKISVRFCAHKDSLDSGLVRSSLPYGPKIAKLARNFSLGWDVSLYVAQVTCGSSCRGTASHGFSAVLRM